MTVEINSVLTETRTFPPPQAFAEKARVVTETGAAETQAAE